MTTIASIWAQDKNGVLGTGTSMVHAPAIDPTVWAVDPQRSDSEWNEKSGDARWKVTTYVRR